jgi:hypothetical protein
LALDHSLILGYLDSADISESERARYEDTLKEIWDTYPTKSVQRGDVTYILLEKTPVSEAGKNLGYDEHGSLGLDPVAEAVYEGVVAERGKRVSISWNPSTHSKMADLSGRKMGISSTYVSTASQAADDPDSWPQRIFGGVELSGYVEIIVHSWEHYYNPNTGSGDAPDYARNYANAARSDYLNLSFTDAFTKLGYALHFIQDVGQPLHTGKEYSQYEEGNKAGKEGKKSLHALYEDYVSNNWTTGYNFASTYNANGYYYAVSNPRAATVDLAKYSNQYLDELWMTIFDYPSTFGSNTRVRQITENCLLKTALYAKGFYWYVALQ